MNTRMAAALLGACLTSSIFAHVTVDFSTYLGGSSQEQANAVAADSRGNVIVVGLSDSANFAVVNAPPSTNQVQFGNWDFFVTKFDSQGRVLFSRRLGGDRTDVATAVATDAEDQIYVLGSTLSTNFPTVNPLPSGAALAGDQDLVLLKLSPAGELLFSTFIGGSRQEVPSGLAMHTDGNVYVTLSSDSADLPAGLETRTHGPGGKFDVVLMKINTVQRAIEQSIRLGGSETEAAIGVVIANGWLHLGGWTASRDFPLAGASLGERSTHPQDGFVTRVNLSSGDLTLSSYFGNGYHNGAAINAIATDSTGHTYLAGSVATNLQATAGSVGSGAANPRGPFVTKIRPNGSIAWTGIVNGPGGAASVAVDAEGKVILVGGATGPGFPVAEPLQAEFAGGSDDAFVSVISRDGTALLFSTYYGGNTALHSDNARAVAVNGTGRIAIAGRTSSRYDQAFNYRGFPVKNAYQDNHAGNGDAFLFQIHGYNEITAVPRLEIHRLDDASIVLRFPPNAFNLESAETLLNPQWAPVSVVPGASSATNAIEGRARFFRLRQR